LIHSQRGCTLLFDLWDAPEGRAAIEQCDVLPVLLAFINRHAAVEPPPAAAFLAPCAPPCRSDANTHFLNSPED
jgi:hypothetical protein